MVKQTRGYKLGWFPEQGYMDALDKKLSKPIMQLEIGKLEYFLAVPGIWCALPPAAWGVIPLWIGSVVDEREDRMLVWLLGICIPISIAWTVLFYYFIINGRIETLYIASKWLLLPCAVCPTFLAGKVLGPSSRHVVALTICSWLLTETLSHIIKISSRRMRPVVSFATELSAVNREIPCVQAMLVKGDTAFHSFPSGDAAGAMVFSYVLHLHGAGVWSWLLVILSCFGRVYFHAHHVSDVLIGSWCGYFCTNRIVGWFGLLDGGMNSLHTSIFMVAFASFHILARKYLSFDIPAEFKLREPSPAIKEDRKTAKNN